MKDDEVRRMIEAEWTRGWDDGMPRSIDGTQPVQDIRVSLVRVPDSENDEPGGVSALAVGIAGFLLGYAGAKRPDAALAGVAFVVGGLLTYVVVRRADLDR